MNLSPAHLSLLLDNSIDAVLWMDQNGSYRYVSPAFADLTGHAPEELIADPGLFERLLHPGDMGKFHGHLEHFAAPGHARLDLRLIHKNGETRWFAHYCKPVFDATSGQQLGRISHNRDITAHKQAELQLRKSMKQAQGFRNALDHVNAFVYIRDREHRFVYANQMTTEFFGRTARELTGVPDTQLFPPATITQMRAIDRRVLAGEDAAGEVTVLLPDGAERFFWLSQSPFMTEGDNGSILGITGIATDITAQRRGEQALALNLDYQRELNRKLEALRMQLLQTEKMASLGQFAAGMAHEINNPIGFVGGNLHMLQTYLDDLLALVDAYAAAPVGADQPALARAHALRQEKDYAFMRSDIAQLMAETCDGISRVTRIVSDLRNFSHPGEDDWQLADLHRELDASIRMAGLGAAAGDGCRIVRDYGDLPPIRCVPAELNQVFINLLANAAQATAATGEITVRTGRQGDEVFVAIGDTGSGIAPEHLTRIFDPFFTTKPVGQGTGLGLALAYSIVQKHHGRIQVSSEPGKGSTFTVWLPLAPPAETP